MQSIAVLLRAVYTRAVSFLNLLQYPLLLFIRVYWGIQLADTGWGKLHNIGKVTEFFTSLNLPAPHATAVFVGLLEFAGGILLAIGLGSRLVSLAVFINMTVAYWASDREAFLGIFSAPDKFYGADPFIFWFTALLILVFGPGVLALDWFFSRLVNPIESARKQSFGVANGH
jgi:putative oxidoreductase